VLRDSRIREIIHDLAARFLLENSNNSSLLTVTDVRLSGKGKYATVLFTVFPPGKDGELEKTALEFAKRKRGEFKQYVIEKSSMGQVPHMDFEIDFGEKNRQKVDELLNEDEQNVGENN
jgi:ribosome-binding factor A